MPGSKLGTEMNENTDFEDIYQSHHLAEKTTDRPLIRVMALHALAYCERLFYLEEVEEIRVADANVYAGRRMHDKIDKGPDIYTLELASERLGIRGKIDCVSRNSGRLMIYEHKKGRSRKGVDAWPSDKLQVLAYALLLSEHSGEPVEDARIRYHADNKTIKIPISAEEAEKTLQEAVMRAETLRSTIERPPVNVSEIQCRNCSLAPVCLPEEERFASREKSKPLRLFPPDDDRRIIHVVEQGCSLRKDGHQIIVYFPDGKKKALPGKNILSIALHGNVQISTQTIHFCAANDIGVHWLSYGGRYVGGVNIGIGGVQRKNRQYQAFRSGWMSTALAMKTVKTKIENQLKYILRITRPGKDGKRLEETDVAINGMRAAIRELAIIEQELKKTGENINQPEAVEKEKEKALIKTIRGIEGKAGQLYFSQFPHVLSIKPDDLMFFDGRNRRPPKDPFNALLSFGYSLVYKDCVASLMVVGLDPCFGYFHTPRSAAYPLAMDLMDLFRVILWDIPVIGSVNRGQWGKDDFEVTKNQVWLNADGRKKAIGLYENRKSEKWKHPVLNYSLSYSRTIELEARLLEKEWSGNPGLFANLRLR